MMGKTGFVGFVRKRVALGVTPSDVYTMLYGMVLGWVLFRSWIGVVLSGGLWMVLSLCFPDNGDSHRAVLRQTADILEAMASALSSGNNPVKAQAIACAQVQEMYSSTGIDSVQAVDILCSAGTIGDTSGYHAFMRLGESIGSVEVRAFASALHVLEVKGGNMALLCGDTCDILRRECDLQEEVETMRIDMDLSRNILFATIPGVLALLQAVAPDFLLALYSGAGRIVAMIVEGLVMISWVLGRKLCQIT